MSIPVETILFSRKSAAQALSISLRSVDYLIKNGTFKTTTFGGKRLIPREQILKLAKNGLASPLAGPVIAAGDTE